MKKILNIVSFLTIVFLICGVYAIPLFSTDFYGTVSVGGNPVKTGYTITAIINGTEKGSITLEEDGIYGGPGGTDPKLIVNPGEIGDTIIFLLDNHQATETADFDSEIHNLDLTFPAFCGDGFCNNGETCSSCSQDCGTCPPTGGGTPPSGGGAYIPPCTEDWTCMDWSMCVNDEQVRTCTDINACGTTKNKPEETQECVPELPKVCASGQKVCSGDNIMECDGGDWLVVESCEFGCSAGRCLTEQQETEQDVIEKEEPSGITGLFLDPTTIYIGFLAILAIFGGLLFLKFH